MGLDVIVANEEKWLKLAKFSEKVHISKERIKTKFRYIFNKNSRIESFRAKKINRDWYIAESEADKFSLEAECLDSGEYYPIRKAAKIIGMIFRKSGTKSCSPLIGQWISRGYMRGIALAPKTCVETYLKKEWVDEFAKTRKYRMTEAARILGTTTKRLRELKSIDEQDERRFRTEFLPSGIEYITEDEIRRQAKLLGADKIPKGKAGIDRDYTGYEKWIILEGVRPGEMRSLCTDSHETKKEKDRLGFFRKDGTYVFALDELERLADKKFTVRNNTAGFGKENWVQCYASGGAVYFERKNAMTLLFKSMQAKTEISEFNSYFEEYFANKVYENKSQGGEPEIEEIASGEFDHDDFNRCKNEFWKENPALRQNLYKMNVWSMASKIIKEYINKRKE
jgi:hypothetical protein